MNPTSLCTNVAIFLFLFVRAAMAGQAGAVGTTPPRPLGGNPFPEYPRQALENDIEGEVLYRVRVDAGGRVGEIEVLAVPREGVGFEDAARSALGEWSFEPALRDGEPVAGYFEGRFGFWLTHSSSSARMYAVPSARLWRLVEALLEEYRFGLEEIDAPSGVIITQWRKWPAKSLHGLTHPDSAASRDIRRFQLHVFVPRILEPARLYIGSVGETGKGRRLIHYNLGHIETWLYEQVEARLGVKGAAVPRNAARRDGLAARLLGERADNDCPAISEVLSLESDELSPPALIPSTKLVPAYPAKPFRPRETARVVLLATVNEDGWVSSVDPIQLPRSNPEFYVAAANAVTFWRYRPAMKDGCPVPVFLRVYVQFHSHTKFDPRNYFPP